MFIINYKKPSAEETEAIKNSLLQVGTSDRKLKKKIIMPCILTFYNENNKAIYSIKTDTPRITYKEILRGRIKLPSVIAEFTTIGIIAFKNSHHLDILFPLIELNKRPIINEQNFKDDFQKKRYYVDSDINSYNSTIDNFEITIKEHILSKEIFERWI